MERSNKMKVRAFVLAALVAAFFPMLAEAQVPAGYMIVDSLVYTPVEQMDTLACKDYRTALPSNVSINQSTRMGAALDGKIARNADRTMRGYRIRIYFDNKQESRVASEAVELSFRAQFPWMGTYRTFQNPYFKVTVGNFRTKSEALAALGQIKASFPSAFIVREKFRFPELSGVSAYRVDTLHLIKPIAQPE